MLVLQERRHGNGQKKRLESFEKEEENNLEIWKRD
jgi:hypothetical protein